MAGVVGFEPTVNWLTANRLTYLATLQWWAGRDSNPHWAAFETAASAGWATSPQELVETKRIELFTHCLQGNVAALGTCAPTKWYRRLESNQCQTAYETVGGANALSDR
jgi:hypothetical protein